MAGEQQILFGCSSDYPEPEGNGTKRLREAWQQATEGERIAFLDGLRREFLLRPRSTPELQAQPQQLGQRHRRQRRTG